MNRVLTLVAVVGLGWGAFGLTRASAQEKKAKTPAELEKEKALANPYPNDLGPATLDEAYLKSLSKDEQEGYKLLQVRCAKCHQPSRPLNSQFIEAPGKTDAERDAALAKWKKDSPEMFKNKLAFQPEAHVWSRYVHRMMSKPGCDIPAPEGKKIWEFLVQDSVNRKTGKNLEKWEEHREKLIKEFKEQHPARYKELFGDVKEEKTEKKDENKG